MEIDYVLIQALSEPQNYSEWYFSSLNLRKKNGEQLSRRTFNKYCKILLEDKIVTSKKINGRENEYQIDSNEKLRFLSLKEDEKIIERLLKDSERVKKGLSINFFNAETTWQDNPHATEVPVYKINHLLLIQKRLSLLGSWIKTPRIHKSLIRECIKKCNLTIKNYFQAYGALDKDLNERIFASLLHESKREIFDETLYPTIWKVLDKRSTKKK